ncbi:MAG: hypothetical protein C0401_11280 [Anaerolinea sp.]|nr:hypothetical protein [Anaerolinea sp.]
MNWSDLWSFAQWLGASIIGALVVKLVDCLFQRAREEKARKKEKVDILLDYVNDFTNLSDLYKLYANYSEKLVPVENPNPDLNWVQNSRLERHVLEPDEIIYKAIQETNGKSLENIILEKTIQVKLFAGQMVDLSDELDSSGQIRKMFNNLYVKTIYIPHDLLNNRDESTIKNQFLVFMAAIKDAEEIRKELRRTLETILKR